MILVILKLLKLLEVWDILWRKLMIKEAYFKRLRLIFIALIIVLATSFIVNRIIINQFSLEVYNLQTKIVGISLANDTELEEQLSFNRDNQEAASIGKNALNKFGIDRDSIISTSSIQELLRKMNIISIS